jgi:hypothetical protein
MKRNIRSPLGIRTPVIQMKLYYFIYWVPIHIGHGFRDGKDTIGLKTKIYPRGVYWNPDLQLNIWSLSQYWLTFRYPLEKWKCLDPRNVWDTMTGNWTPVIQPVPIIHVSIKQGTVRVSRSVLRRAMGLTTRVRFLQGQEGFSSPQRHSYSVVTGAWFPWSIAAGEWKWLPTSI